MRHHLRGLTREELPHYLAHRLHLAGCELLCSSRLPSRPTRLEIFEEWYQQRSTIVTSQFPIEHWHEPIGDPTLADAILDRLVHNAYKLNLKGESLRKQRKTLTDTDHLNS